jgi:hypothetical protein
MYRDKHNAFFLSHIQIRVCLARLLSGSGSAFFRKALPNVFLKELFFRKAVLEKP